MNVCCVSIKQLTTKRFKESVLNSFKFGYQNSQVKFLNTEPFFIIKHTTAKYHTQLWV